MRKNGRGSQRFWAGICWRSIILKYLCAGPWAKPIIDIMPVVERIGGVDRYNHGFETIGYECMGEFGIPGRRYFRKGGEKRTHQIHIFERGTGGTLSGTGGPGLSAGPQRRTGGLRCAEAELAGDIPTTLRPTATEKRHLSRRWSSALDWYHACRAV